MTSRSEYLAKMASRLLDDDAEDDSSFDGDENNNFYGASPHKQHHGSSNSRGTATGAASSQKSKPNREPLSPLSANRNHNPQPKKLWDDDADDDADNTPKKRAATIAKLSPPRMFSRPPSRVRSNSSSGLAKRAASFMLNNVHKRFGSYGNLKELMGEAGESSGQNDRAESKPLQNQHGQSVNCLSSSAEKNGQNADISDIHQGDGLPPKAALQRNKSTEFRKDLLPHDISPIPRHRGTSLASSTSAAAAMVAAGSSKPRDSLELQARNQTGQPMTTSSSMPSPAKHPSPAPAPARPQSRRFRSKGKASLSDFISKSSSFSSTEGDALRSKGSSEQDGDDAVSSVFDGVTIDSSASGGSGHSRSSAISRLGGKSDRRPKSRDANNCTSGRNDISCPSPAEGIETFKTKDAANAGDAQCDESGVSMGSSKLKNGSVASSRRKELNRLKRLSKLDVGVLGLSASGSTESQETEASLKSPAHIGTMEKVRSNRTAEPFASAEKASSGHARHQRVRSLAAFTPYAEERKHGNRNDGMGSLGRERTCSSAVKSSLMTTSKPKAPSNKIVTKTEPVALADHDSSGKYPLGRPRARLHTSSLQQGKIPMTPSKAEDKSSDVVREQTPMSRGRSGFNRSRHHFRSNSLSRGSARTPPRPGRSDSSHVALQTMSDALTPSADIATKRFERRRSRSRPRQDFPPRPLPSVSPCKPPSSLTTAVVAVAQNSKNGESDRLRNRRKASIRNLSPPPSSLPQTSKSPTKSPLLESGQAYLRRNRRESKSSLSQPPRSLSYSSNVMAADSQISNMSVVAKISTSKKQSFLPIAKLCTAVIPMQCLARCYLAKCRIEKRYLSILQVQSCIRMWACQRQYRSIKMLCIRLQSLFRGNLTRDELYYRHVSAMKIQRIVRGYLTFVSFIEDMGKVILVQSLARRKIQQEKYEDFCWAASTIQLWYRRKKHEELVKLDYIWDVIVAQSAARMWLAKRRVLGIHCVKIQSAWRMFVCKSDFAFTVIDITLVQTKVRQWLALRRADELRRRVEAATIIQSAVRARNVYLHYLWTICSVILCQSIVRKFNSIQHTSRLKELRKNTAAMTIQCAYRRHAAMSNYIFLLSDVILCQSIVRRFQSIQLARRMKDEIHRKHNDAAALIQSAFRRHVAMNYYAFFLSDIILCQSIARRFLSIQLFRRKKIETLQKQNDAAVSIQATFRRHMAMSDYIFAVSDIILCQTIARRFLSMQRARKLRSDLTHRNAAATLIQSSFRRYLSISNYFFTLADIVCCQSIWRRQLAIHQLDRLRRHAAATIIQRTFRRHITMSNYIFTLSDIIICQSVWRMKLATMQADKIRRRVAATMIQSTFRRHISMSTYIFTLSDIIICQSVCRRLLAIRKAEYMAKERRSAVVIQTLARRWIARKLLEQKKLRRDIWIKQERRMMNAAATSIQKIVRGRIAYYDFVITMVSIITCQSAARRWRSKRRLNVLRTQQRESAAVKIQAVYRGFSIMKCFVITLCKVITVQTAFRGWISRRELHYLKEEKRRIENVASIKLQKMFRGFSCYMKYSLLSFSAVELQRVIRGFLAREKFIIDLANIILVQSVARRFITKKRAKQIRLVQNLASTKISSTWRGFVDRCDFAVMLSGFVLLQATARGCDVRRQVLRETVAATAIQRVYRGFVTYNSYILDCASIILCQAGVRKWLAVKDAARRRHEKRQEAVTVIQSAWRRFLAESNFIIALSGCVLLQCFVRRFIASKQYKAQQRTRKNAASRIQSAYRSRLYFNRYIDSLIDIIRCQSYVRKYLAMKKLSQLHRIKSESAATRIQAAFRGYTSHMDFVLTICDVIICQSVARRWLSNRTLLIRLQDLQMKNCCATVIQVRWRAYIVERRRFIVVYTGVALFQSLVRGVIERKRMARVHYSRVLVESNILMHQESFASIVLQRWWRSQVANQLNIHTAATSIQSCYRGFRAYQNYVTLLYIILKIQGLARGHLCRVRLKQKIATLNVASTNNMRKNQKLTIENAYATRRKHATTSEEAKRKRQKAAALVIERFFISIKAEIEREIQKLLKQEESQRKESTKLQKNSRGRKRNGKRKVTKQETNNFHHSPNCIRPSQDVHALRLSFDSLTPNFNRLPTPDNSNVAHLRFANHPPMCHEYKHSLNMQERAASPVQHNATDGKFHHTPPRPNLGIQESSSFAARMLPRNSIETSQGTNFASAQSSTLSDRLQHVQINAQFAAEHTPQHFTNNHTFTSMEKRNLNAFSSAQMRPKEYYHRDNQQQWISEPYTPNSTNFRNEQNTRVHHIDETAPRHSNSSQHVTSRSNQNKLIHAVYSDHSIVSTPSSSIPRDDSTSSRRKPSCPEPNRQAFFRPMSQNSLLEYDRVRFSKTSPMPPSKRRENLSYQPPPVSSGDNKHNKSNIPFSLPNLQPQVQVLPEHNSGHSDLASRQHIIQSPSPSHHQFPMHRQSNNIPCTSTYYPQKQNQFSAGHQNQSRQQNNLYQYTKLRLTRSYNRDA